MRPSPEGRDRPRRPGYAGGVLGGLLVILVCQLIGDLIVRATGLPVPGPVVGMLLFLVWLLVRKPA